MASVLFGFIDSLNEGLEGAVSTLETEVDGAIQQLDAGVDLDEVLEEIEQAGGDEAALLTAYRRLETLASGQAPAVLRGWVVEGRVVPAACTGLCRAGPLRRAAGPLAKVLNGMGGALEQTEATPEELRAYAEQLVRHTENGRAMLKLMQVDEPEAQAQSLALLRRVYPYKSSDLGRHLLSDPESIAALVQILQAAGGSPWTADVAEGSTEATLCAECVQFLRLITREDEHVRTILAFQDGVEALLAIVAQALGTLQSAESILLMSIAADVCACVQQLATHGAVVQKLMRENGQLSAVLKTLRCVTSVLAVAPAANKPGLEAIVVALMAAIAAFTDSAIAGSEAAVNAAALVQGTPLVEAICVESLPAVHLGHEVKVRMLDVLLATLAAADEGVLRFLVLAPSGAPVLDGLVAMLLEDSTPLPTRAALDRLLAAGLGRSAYVRNSLAQGLEVAGGAAEVTEAPEGAAPPDSPRKAPSSPKISRPPSALEAGRRLYAVLSGAAPRAGGGSPPSGWLADPPVWFAAHLLGHCLRGGGTEMRARLARAEGAGCESALSAALAPLAALARAWRSSDGRTGSEASLCAVLRLVAEWCERCPSAAHAFAGSPAYLPEMIALFEAVPQADGAGEVHMQGLAALLLGMCLLELSDKAPDGTAAGAALITSTRLMQLIAARIGVDRFTRAGEQLQRALAAAGSSGMLAIVQRYDAGFSAFAARHFQRVQEVMVQIWLSQGSAPSGADAASSLGAGSVGASARAGLAEDVAEHFKDLIKMQDKELRNLRAETKKLKEENEQLRKLTTDEDKTLLLWRVTSLTKHCEALQGQCDTLQAATSGFEAARLRERQAQRAQRRELERQLQALAVALDEAELRAAAAQERARTDSEASQEVAKAEVAKAETGKTAEEGEEEKEREERDRQCEERDKEREELLRALEAIHRGCPEARAFLAPLSHFAAPAVDQQVKTAEAEAEAQAEAMLTASAEAPDAVAKAAQEGERVAADMLGGAAVLKSGAEADEAVKKAAEAIARAARAGEQAADMLGSAPTAKSGVEAEDAAKEECSPQGPGTAQPDQAPEQQPHCHEEAQQLQSEAQSQAQRAAQSPQQAAGGGSAQQQPNSQPQLWHPQPQLGQQEQQQQQPEAALRHQLEQQQQAQGQPQLNSHLPPRQAEAEAQAEVQAQTRAQAEAQAWAQAQAQAQQHQQGYLGQSSLQAEQQGHHSPQVAQQAQLAQQQQQLLLQQQQQQQEVAREELQRQAALQQQQQQQQQHYEQLRQQSVLQQTAAQAQQQVTPPQPQPDPAHSQGLPQGWAAYRTVDGHLFFNNHFTGESRWERPVGD
uniref:WW domain-containing protein n=1 Tax=Alexandrium monilatum TaxID=311494 RepID=A0A7S4QN90_9DINO